MSASHARFALRAATTDAHERVDALYSRFDLAGAAGYADFLVAQAGAYLAIEAALDRAGAENVLPDWPRRRRAEALRRDLAVLGLKVSASDIEAPALGEAARVIGAIYVLEGSRLGGTMLLRSVPQGQPTEFLSTRHPDLWRVFIARLDCVLADESRLETAKFAALDTFECFERSARLALEMRS